MPKPIRPPKPPVPGVLQTYLIYRNWLPFLDWCRRRVGDTFTIWAPPLGRLHYFAKPEDIKAIFTSDPKLLHAGEANAPLLEPALGPSSLLVLDEDRHLADRKLMLPHFHGDAVRRYRDTIAQIAAAEVDRWRGGDTIKVRPRMQAVTLEVILRAVIGVTDPKQLAELRPRLRAIANVSTVQQLAWLAPWLERVPPWRGFRRLMDETDRLLYEEIARRRQAPDLEERGDVLSLLILARDDSGRGLSDSDLRDELLTLLMAGHETTATGLAWAFERLTRTPAAMQRLRTELENGGDERYLDATVKETLRVRPVIADVIRKLTRDVEFQGYDLKAGELVAPAIGLVQRSAEHWDDPLAFRPERFLGGAPDSYTWIPFGGGVRRCLGAAFAQLEMKVVLQTVLERVELEPARAKAERTRVRHVTLVPSRGGEVVVRRRLVSTPAGEPELAAAAQR